VGGLLLQLWGFCGCCQPRICLLVWQSSVLPEPAVSSCSLSTPHSSLPHLAEIFTFRISFSQSEILLQLCFLMLMTVAATRGPHPTYLFSRKQSATWFALNFLKTTSWLTCRLMGRKAHTRDPPECGRVSGGEGDMLICLGKALLGKKACGAAKEKEFPFSSTASRSIPRLVAHACNPSYQKANSP
jgi:hypothetical protein